ncbi:hypothetical protein ACIPZG_06270 [Pseudomonas sp. NPDC089395]|uniref:hypothetical protein n=1 Tax=Pseudomonas sp. NPDC089395 TaxID=3364460 RepID=UPI0038198C70
MQNYSDNWRLLTTLTAKVAATHQSAVARDYSEHANAQMLGCFLAHAKLTTPNLGRDGVKALFTGEQAWPLQDGTCRWVRVDVSVDQLEELGVIAFYGDWCTVHSDSINDAQALDLSLQPMLEALRVLRDIRAGNAGFAPPQYSLPFDQALQLLVPTFGERTATAWLESLEHHADGCRWPSRDSRLPVEAITQLWLTLRSRLDPPQAFKLWLECQCVGRDWVQSIDFAYLPVDERQVFIEQLTAHLATDRALAKPLATLQRQACNADRLSQLLRPVQERVDIHIDAEGVRTTSRREVPQVATTFSSLAAEYPTALACDASPLQFVVACERLRHVRYGMPLFHLGLLLTVIDETVRVEGAALISTGFAERLLELAHSRPILKYLALMALPQFSRSKTYLLLLLSKPETCDAALYFLVNHSHYERQAMEGAVAHSLDSGYHQILCGEYCRTIAQELEAGERLCMMVEYLACRCNWSISAFARRPEYRLLITFLQGLSERQVVQLSHAFTGSLLTSATCTSHRTAEPQKYLIAFWLLERLEQITLSAALTSRSALLSAILEAYANEFSNSIATASRTLEPEECYAVLPWVSTAEHGGLTRWLSLSHDHHSWLAHLSSANANSFAVSRAIRQYLQVLMSMQPPQLNEQDHQRVMHRVASIVIELGFGQGEETLWLFHPGLQSERDRVWHQFSRYVGHFPDSLFADFQERCLPHVPLDLLFTLMENCALLHRQQQLKQAIAQRHGTRTEEMGLTALEESFISAVNSGELALGGTLIQAAMDFIGAERFVQTRNPLIVQSRKAWANYQFKWQLLTLMERWRHAPDAYAEKATALEIPHDLRAVSEAETERKLHQDCQNFRQYIIAAAYRDSDVGRCARSMAELFSRTQDPSHGLLLLQSRIDIYRQDSDRVILTQTLHSCLASIAHLTPPDMSAAWATAVLEAYALLGDTPKLDAFWTQLSGHQQTQLEILRPYCRALIQRGEVLVAQHLATRFRELNPLALQSGSFTQLMDELANAAPPQITLSQMVQLMTHDSRRSVAQLVADYQQLLALDFHQYVEVVGNGLSTETFLAQCVFEVAGELLLRKKNLQWQAPPSSRLANRRITHEDLINDWFTSLFDKRMAEARVGIRDQKRAGESASGMSPGEADGVITDAKNRRLAIVEAFRLFSLDLTVIRDHLNKVARYDQECLSPVFILAYCDVSDFAALTHSYAELIGSLAYFGFQHGVDSTPSVVPQPNSNLWVTREYRTRGGASITVYHLLLNMRSPATHE